MILLDGKVALVTGGSAGIGRAAARQLARAGARVVIASRRAAEGEETIAEIERGGGTALFVRGDVAMREDVARVVEKSLQAFGRLDILVNNAGFEGRMSSILEMPEADWRRVLAVNLHGTFYALKYGALAMGRSGGGSMINVGSVESYRGLPDDAGYVASKHAVLGLTKAASAELAPLGVRVNIVCPGWTNTPLLDRVRLDMGEASVDDYVRRTTHVGRAGTPDEVAGMIVWLASDAASYVTGASLVVDGGLLATLPGSGGGRVSTVDRLAEDAVP